MIPPDCSVLRIYTPFRSVQSRHPPDVLHPTILPNIRNPWGPVSSSDSVVAERVPPARSNPTTCSYRGVQ